MKTDKFLKIWLNKDIEDWGSDVSKEYKDFQSNYRSVLKEIGKEINFDLYSFNKNHYEFSAVMKSNITEQFYYISISDVRYFKNEWAKNILYRTMKDEKDWTGGYNQYSSLEDLSNNLIGLDKRIEREIKNNEDYEIEIA